MATSSPVLLGAGPDQFVLDMSEDAYAGDAVFTVTVDGVQIGGAQTVTALHTLSERQRFVVQGDFGVGPHQVGIDFLNDAFGGTKDTDRNLYVERAISGGQDLDRPAALYFGGTQTLTLVTPSRPITLGTGPDSIVLTVSEDAYKGNAQFTVSVDGVQFGGVQTATALHGSSEQTITLLGNFGLTPHAVTVNFLNDLYDGTPSTDRNLYVDSVTRGGTSAAPGATLLSTGPRTFNLGYANASTGPQTVGTGPDSLVLKLSEDAYDDGNGIDAQFTVLVDGRQIGGVLFAGASHANGASQDFTLLGNFGAGPHTVTVNFLNDSFNAATSQDRNLYVDGVVNGGLISTLNIPLYFKGGSTTFIARAPSAILTGSVTGPAGGYALLNGTPGDDTITARGDGNTIILGTPRDAQAAQTDTVSLSGNNNTLLAGDGTVILGGTGTDNNLTLGGGDNVIKLDGARNTLSLGAGSNTVALTGGDATIQISEPNYVKRNFDTVTLSGQHNTVTSGGYYKFGFTGSLAISGGNGYGSFSFGSGGGSLQTDGLYNTVSFGAGTYDISPGSGYDTVTAIGSPGSPIGTVHLAGTHNTVTATSSIMTVLGGDGFDTVTITGRPFNGETTPAIITLGGPSNTVTLRNPAATVDAGSGQDTVNLNGGNAALVFHGSGNMLFVNYTPAFAGNTVSPSATISDQSSGLQVILTSDFVSLTFNQLGAGAVIHLPGGPGQFTTAAQAFAALAPDPAGGRMLALGAPANGPTPILHFASGVALDASNFQIG